MSLKIVLKNQRFFAPRKVVSQFFGHLKSVILNDKRSNNKIN